MPFEFVNAVPNSGVILPVNLEVKLISWEASGTPSSFSIALTTPLLSLLTGFSSVKTVPSLSRIIKSRVIEPETPVSPPCPPLD